MTDRRRLWLGCAAVLLFALGTLTACTVSVGGGIAGIISALALLGLLFGLGTTQTGCTQACLSIVTDAGPADGKVSDSGGEGELGACLSFPPDAGPELGPCLSPLPPDAGLGPCLSPLPPDAGLGPCLTMPLPDASASLQSEPPAPTATAAGSASERDAALARLADRMPADVLERLRDGRRRS